MAVAAAVVTVTTTATLLTAGESDTYAGSGLAISVPNGGATVYIAAADVTTATGFPLAAGDRVTLDLQAEAVYGIVASGTQAVNVLRVGV